MRAQLRQCLALAAGLLALAAPAAQAQPEAFMLDGCYDSPSISGDGKWVACVCMGGGLCLADTDTREVQTLVSQSDNAKIGKPDISRNGRFIAYWHRLTGVSSSAQLFVYDRVDSSIEMVSVNSDEEPAEPGTFSAPAISGDGRYVVFKTTAGNLVPNDAGGFDVFVRDRELGVTERVNVAWDGGDVDVDYNSADLDPRISNDGRYVVFDSQAENLVSEDAAEYYAQIDVFLADRESGTIRRLSGLASNPDGSFYGAHGRVAISPDGRFATFNTEGSDLVSGVVVKPGLILANLDSGALVHANPGTVAPASNFSVVDRWLPDFSFDGELLYFCSDQTDLVAGDAEGDLDVFRYRNGEIVRVRPVIGGVETAICHPGTDDTGNTLVYEVPDTGVGVLKDDIVGPEILAFGLIPPDAIPQGGLIEVEGLASDIGRGEATVVSAEYAVDGGDWLPADAFDGAFDSSNERIQAFAGTDELALGQHTVCARATDAAGNTGPEACADVSVVEAVLAEDIMLACWHEPIWPQPGEQISFHMEVYKRDLSSLNLQRLNVQRLELWFSNDRSSPSHVVDEYRSDIDPYVITARDTPGSPAYGCRVRLNDASVFTGWRQIRVGPPADDGAIPVVNTGPSDNSLDLVFIADQDTYGTPDDPGFQQAVGDLVRDAIYKYPLYNQYQHRFNIWLAQQPGKSDRENDDAPCVLTKPPDWDENYAFAEVGVILHSDVMRDCSALGGLFSTEPPESLAFRTFRHEAGHKFGLSDEYCCNTSYSQSGVYPNVYATLEACESDAPNLGREPADCRSWVREADGVEWFGSEPAVDDLMSDETVPNAADIRRIQYYFETVTNIPAPGLQP